MVLNKYLDSDSNLSCEFPFAMDGMVGLPIIERISARYLSSS